jgi:hypothetical protein
MKKCILLVTLMIVFIGPLGAQPRALSTRSIAGSTSNQEHVYPIALSIDGNNKIYSAGWFSHYIRTPMEVYGTGKYLISFTSTGSSSGGNSNSLIKDMTGYGGYNYTIGGLYVNDWSTLVTGYGWSFQLGSFNPNNYYNIDTDNSGNIYLTGYGVSGVDLDPGAGSVLMPGNGYFVAVYSSSGPYVRSFIMPAGVTIMQMSLDNANNVLIAGSFTGTVDFSVSETRISQSGTDGFLAKYTSTGSLLWVDHFSDDSSDGLFTPKEIAADASGNVIVIGELNSGSAVDFNPNPTVTDSRTSNGSTDFLLAKYDQNGVYQFAYNFGDNIAQSGTGVKTDLAGNIYCIGTYAGTVDFDPDPVKQKLLTAYVEDTPNSHSSRNNDFLIKFLSNGTFQWVTGGIIGEGFGIEIDSDQNLICQSQRYNKDIIGNWYQSWIWYISYSHIVKFDQPLSISSYSLSKAPVGTTLTINGLNFSTTPSQNLLYFNGIQATVLTSTSDRITTVIPAGAITGQQSQTIPVTLTVGSRTATSSFLVTYPKITSVNTGKIGSTIPLTTDTGGSTGAVTYSVANNTGSATVSGTTLTLTGLGTVTVTASIAGDANYNSNTATQVVTITCDTKTITPGSIGAVCPGTSTSTLTYTATTGSPNQYRIDWNAAANTAGMIDVVTPLALPVSPIAITGITSTPGTYTGTIYVSSSSSGCESAGNTLSVVVKTPPTITLSPIAPGCAANTSASLYYTATTETPNQYRIDWDAVANAAGLPDKALTSPLPASPIYLGGFPAITTTFNGLFYVKNSTTGCESVGIPISLTKGFSASLGSMPSICSGPTSSTISYTNIVSTATKYLIDWTSGIPDVSWTNIPAGQINVTGIPANSTTNPITYTGTLLMQNAINCSTNFPMSVTVKPIPTITNLPSSVDICSPVSNPQNAYYTFASNMSNASFGWTPTYTYLVSGGEDGGGNPFNLVHFVGDEVQYGYMNYDVRAYVNGCASAPKNFTVNVYNQTQGSISQSGDLCMWGVVYLTTGSGDMGWWSTGGYASTIAVYNEGEYSVTYTEHNCTVNASIYVTRGSSEWPCIMARKKADEPVITKSDELVITKTDEPGGFSIYPNPASHEVTISLSARVEENTPISFTDLLGRTSNVGIIEKGAFKTTVQTSQLMDGVYLVRIKNSKVNLLQKIAIVK